MAIAIKQDIYSTLRSLCMEMREKKEKMSVTDTMMRLMDVEGLPIHCPHHHFIVPAALLTQAAIEREISEKEFQGWLSKAERRGKSIPGGICGECGACGAGIGIGIFFSVINGTTPKSGETWKWANQATGNALLHIASYGGPRCCKRTSFLAVLHSIDFINEKCELHLSAPQKLKCRYHDKNTECLREKCPFYPTGENNL